ncbi:MAG: bifunctional anthranilate synthase component II/anthranilate phosphoribosyltransferase [Lachnospiraceae bacterium]|nr:bifunctional anthranilate synthase component II/anthranilate phosphoribosyltransferase [Lachnospiraceae bacterium]
MILLIDNYDSFTYNLYQLLGSIGPKVEVIRNDVKTVEEIAAMKPEAIILSPGPGRPEDAGICVELIQKLKGVIPIFGVCLGHQAICQAFGATVTYAKELMHGKSSLVQTSKDSILFQGIQTPFSVARYHSLAADRDTLPEELQVTAWTEDGEVMAVEHQSLQIYGVQFHPESVMTPDGRTMMQNFIKTIRRTIMIKEAIVKLSKKQDLTFEEAYEVMNEIMDGKTSQIQTSSYLTALAMKGETIDEITGSATGMREHCVKLLHDMDVLEIVGTGGDGANSFNISTTASMVIAAAGVPVAKHGNRAASSKSGAADVLEALGVKITIPAERSTELLQKINICFLFAQNYHLAMKYVAPVRKELGIRTVFNILGPLTNPAGANMELMGVYEQELVEPLAQVMAKLGVKRGMVVFGQDKLDEISMSAPTSVCEVKDGWFLSYEITPEQFGYTRCSKEDLVGGTPAENAEITKAILNGTDRGPKRQAVCLNAGAALYIAGKAATIEQGVRLAESVIDSGAALAKLEQFIQESNA